jgi:hypothetical protein
MYVNFPSWWIKLSTFISAWDKLLEMELMNNNDSWSSI